MFERFTNRARRVVVLAQEEARLLQHNYIGAEHILLGLIAEDDGLAAKVLLSLDLSLEGLRTEVEEIIGMGGESPTGQIPFTPRAKKVLELSLREALQLGHSYIGTEHILLGLMREGEGVAAEVLAKETDVAGGLPAVRSRVLALLEGKIPESGSGAGSYGPTGPVPAAPRCPRCRRGLAGHTGYRMIEAVHAPPPPEGAAPTEPDATPPEGAPPEPDATPAEGATELTATPAVPDPPVDPPVDPIRAALLYCTACGTALGPALGSPAP